MDDLESKIKDLENQIEELKRQQTKITTAPGFVLVCKNGSVNKTELTNEEIEQIFKELEQDFSNWYKEFFSCFTPLPKDPLDSVRKSLEDQFRAS